MPSANPKLEFHPLTPERWRDFESLFGERGACGGCWCMWPRLARSQYETQKGAGNKRAMKKLVDGGRAPGIIAYQDGQPTGWCSVAPREEFLRLERSRILKPVDEQPVWYDERGNLIEEKGYNDKDELVYKSEYKYDDRNRRIEWLSSSFHPKENSKPHKTTCSRYEGGQVKDKRFYSDEGGGFQPNDNILGGAYRKMYFYDERGKIISTLRFKSNGAFAGMDIARYDYRGNEIEEIEYDANGNLKDKKAYKYKYDRVGNWVEQTTYGLAMGGRESRLRIEEISYQIIKYYPERKSGK